MNRTKKLLTAIQICILKFRAKRIAKKSKIPQAIVKIGGKPSIVGKDLFKVLRQKNVFPKTFTFDGLKKIAIYYTK